MEWRYGHPRILIDVIYMYRIPYHENSQSIMSRFQTFNLTPTLSIIPNEHDIKLKCVSACRNKQYHNYDMLV